MPIQTINRSPSFSQNLTKALGGSLEALTKNKLNEIQHSQRMRGLESLGFSPEQAQSYSSLDPNLLQLVVQQKLQEPSQQAFAQGLQSILGGEAQQNNASQVNYTEGTGGRSPAANQITPQQAAQLQQAVPHLMLPGAPSPQARQSTPTQIPPQIPAKLNPQQAMQLAQLGLQKQALGKKQAAEQRKEDAKLQMQSDKETLPYYNEVLKEDKAAKDIDLKTGRMIQLIEKGKLPDPVYYKQLKDLEESLTPLKTISAGAGAGFTSGATVGGIAGAAFGGIGAAIGAAIGGLVGAATGAGTGLYATRYPTKKRGELLKQFPDTEEFEKLSASFIQGAKSIFGARITDQELRAFMETVPKLSNTEAGKKAIIKNIRTMNDAAHVKANTMKTIIKANGGKRPANLAILVDELSAPELDRLSNQFIG